MRRDIGANDPGGDPSPEPRIVAVCGGSGSGKTTAAHLLRGLLGEDRAAVLSQDSYYVDQSHRFEGDGSVNFDHPSALDFELLARHLARLRAGAPVEVPRYDFVTHTRLERALRLDPTPFVILDGTLLLSEPRVRPHLWRSIYLRTSEPVRFARRLARDTRERGRHPDGVRRQFAFQVKPMHDRFVEPSSRHADHVIENEGPGFERLTSALHRALAPFAGDPR